MECPAILGAFGKPKVQSAPTIGANLLAWFAKPQMKMCYACSYNAKLFKCTRLVVSTTIW
eukprot:6472814-Amphidinium_carterae.1